MDSEAEPEMQGGVCGTPGWAQRLELKHEALWLGQQLGLHAERCLRFFFNKQYVSVEPRI